MRKAVQPPVPPKFLREVEAFERLKPELRQQYKGRVVAIYQDDVYGAVIDKFGAVPCYVDYVQEKPRVARITSIWRVQ